MTIGSLTGLHPKLLHPSSNLFLEKDTAFPAWLRHVEADLAAIDDETKTHTIRATHYSLLNLPERGRLVGNTHGEWSSQLKDNLIGKYIRVSTRAHGSILIVRVKDCGYITISELSDIDLAGGGLPRNLSSDKKKVILLRTHCRHLLQTIILWLLEHLYLPL